MAAHDRRRFGAWLACALLVACSAELVPSASPPTTPTTSPPMASLSSSAAPPSPSDPPLSLEDLSWRVITEPFEDERTQQVAGLFMNPYGELVAWGYESVRAAGSVDNLPTFWTSPNTLVWAEARLGTVGEHLDLADIAAGPNGFAAVGFDADAVAAWWSTNADSWDRATISPQPVPDQSGMAAVGGGTAGYLAVGSEQERAAAWFSSDGLGWKPVEAGFGEGNFWDVTQSPDGGFVVVGQDRSRGDWNAAAWVVSPDAADWRAAEPNDAIAGPGAEDIARVWAFDGGYFAFGHALDPRNKFCGLCPINPETWRLYTSPDGIEWAQHAIDLDQAEPVLLEYTAIEPWGDGLMAVGRGSDGVVRTWLSGDGAEWRPVGEPVDLGALAADEPGVSDLMLADQFILISGGLIGDGYVAVGASR